MHLWSREEMVTLFHNRVLGDRCRPVDGWGCSRVAAAAAAGCGSGDGWGAGPMRWGTEGQLGMARNRFVNIRYDTVSPVAMLYHVSFTYLTAGDDQTPYK